MFYEDAVSLYCSRSYSYGPPSNFLPSAVCSPPIPRYESCRLFSLMQDMLRTPSVRQYHYCSNKSYWGSS